jgi:hypothetical protein
MKDKVIITAAIRGSIPTPTMSSYLPIKPGGIADEAVRACEASSKKLMIAEVNINNTKDRTYCQYLSVGI